MLTNLLDARRNKILYYESASAVHYGRFVSGAAQSIKTWIVNSEAYFYHSCRDIWIGTNRLAIGHKSHDIISTADNLHTRSENAFGLDISEFNPSDAVLIDDKDHTLCPVMTQWGYSNLFHLLFDSIGKIALLSEAVQRDKLRALIPANHLLAKSLLEAMDISYIEFPRHTLVKGNFLIASMPSYCGFVPYNVTMFYSRLAASLFDAIPSEYILVGRRPDRPRHVSNIDDLYALCLKYRPFRMVYWEDMPVEEQLRLGASAKLIISPHGAGMSWGVFSQSCSAIEIIGPSHSNRCYQYIYSCKGFHRYFTATEYHDSNGAINYNINIEEFSEFLTCFFRDVDPQSQPVTR